MNVDRLSTGEKIAAASAIALFIFMFFDWFSVSVSGGGLTSGSLGGGNAWDSLDWIPWFLVITIVVTIGHAVIEAGEADVDTPVHGSTAITVLGGNQRPPDSLSHHRYSRGGIVHRRFGRCVA